MEAIFYLFLLFIKHGSSQNLFANPGFETGQQDPWRGGRLHIETNDVHSGKFSLEIYNRHDADGGPVQTVSVKPGRAYAFKAYIKQLNGNSSNFNIFQTYRALIVYVFTDTGHRGYYDVAEQPLVQPGSEWFTLEGDFIAPSKDFSSAVISISGPEKNINFLLDDVYLHEIKDNITWKDEANTRIENIRKTTVHVQVSHPLSYNPDDVVVHIDQKRHLFGFGCNVSEAHIMDPTYKEYQDIFYSLFNWATVDAFDWKNSKGTTNTPDYTEALKVVDKLISHGLQVRGNAMFWGMKGKSPGWVENLDGQALKSAIKNRVEYITNITQGKVSHWNVNNELLHGQVYEEITRNPQFTEAIFDMVHEADPTVKLYLNDYNVVSSGTLTKAYVELANQVQSANVSLYGLGIMNLPSSYRNQQPDPALLKKHLDDLASTGLPLWVSDLKISNKDANVRADWLEMALRTYFSHPAVEGVTLGAFWDHESDDDSSLFEGFLFQENAAGQRYVDLVEKEWSTHLVYNLSFGPIYPMKAFQGDYDITVYYKGKAVRHDSFSVDKYSFLFKVILDGTEAEITVPTTVDPLSYVTHDMHLVHIHPIHIGTFNIEGNSSALQCVTRQSLPSTDGTSASVSCEDDELLTGCSSLSHTYVNNFIELPFYKATQSHLLPRSYEGRSAKFDWKGFHIGPFPMRSWRYDRLKPMSDSKYRGGEMIRRDRRAGLKCIAVANDLGGVEGRIAIARCCKTSDMDCSYSFGHSVHRATDHTTEVDCQEGFVATGCSLNTLRWEHYGALPTDTQKGCASTHTIGMTGDLRQYAVCCRAESQLACMTVTSDPSGLAKGDNATISCDKDYVMTSCNVKSYSSRTAGSTIEYNSTGKENCVAINGDDKFPGEEGAIAVAVCCRLNDDTVPIIG